MARALVLKRRRPASAAQGHQELATRRILTSPRCASRAELPPAPAQPPRRARRARAARRFVARFDRVVRLLPSALADLQTIATRLVDERSIA
jgi:hypothetical protein